MSFRTVTEITLDYLTSENEPDRESAGQEISEARQAISQASQSIANQRVLPLTVKERETIGPHIEEAFVQETRSRRLHQIMPPLTGPYSVGHTSFTIEGPKSAYSVGDSKIGIEIYAPSKREAGNRTPLVEFPEGHLEGLLSPEQIQTLRTHSHDQIDLIDNGRILIFSHGLGTPPAEYRLLIEELTSHGYLVLSLNHPSSSGYAPFSEITPPNWDALDDPARSDQEFARLASVQAENIRHVVGLIRENSGALGPLVRHADSIVLAGHSLGGAASILAARADPNINGCINLDGALFGKKETRTAGLAAPTLMIFKDPTMRPKKGENGFEEAQQIHRDFESFLKNPSVSSHTIDGIGHMDFCFLQVAKWLAGEDTLANALKAHRVASRAMLRFMDSIPMHGGRL